MPNHVHVVFKPLRRSLEQKVITSRNNDYHSLASIMHSLKGYTAFECNRILKQEGEFWAHESYDHSVRDLEEWNRIVNYVLNNPVKVGFVADWTEWPWNYLRKK